MSWRNWCPSPPKSHHLFSLYGQFWDFTVSVKHANKVLSDCLLNTTTKEGICSAQQYSVPASKQGPSLPSNSTALLALDGSVWQSATGCDSAKSSVQCHRLILAWPLAFWHYWENNASSPAQTLLWWGATAHTNTRRWETSRPWMRGVQGPRKGFHTREHTLVCSKLCSKLTRIIR